jgi:hypothetical protein
MGRVWVLDTETKGTGAEMVPLDKVRKQPAPPRERLLRAPKPRAAREPAPAEPRAPRRFRVVDVATRAVLADDVGARQALDALTGIRSIVDVQVSVWDSKRERWRLLTLDEQRMLWDRRLTAP